MLGRSSPRPTLEAQVSQAGVVARPREPRVSFGVPEIDTMLDGGLMAHRPYLLVGPSGTGKTTLALQFLCDGVQRGERGLYVTIEDPPNEVRWNHRALRPTLDAVDVFDAIPDVMRYERAPFKDISAVREVVPFGKIHDTIRQTPEFTSVEVTGTALEQMLRSEVLKRGYSRLVIDSLTALQYFCMKGFDPIVGAQTFLRFLTELRTTTLLTVEAPLQDVESPERMLARGEIRLFRWELEGATVRAIGVEKLRGSAHDVRLHPYRIGPKGVGVQLDQTISRDTRRIVEPALHVALRGEAVRGPTVPATGPESAATADPLSEQISDLLTLGVDVSPLRGEVEAALTAIRAARPDEATARLTRISGLVIALAPLEPPPAPSGSVEAARASAAFQRVAARADRSRGGAPPLQLPPPDLLAQELSGVLQLVPVPAAAAPPSAGPAPPSAGPTGPSELAAPAPPAVSAGEPGPEMAAPATGPAAAPAPARRRRGPRPAVVAAEPPPLPTVVQIPLPVAPAVPTRTNVSEPVPPPPVPRKSATAARRRRKAPAAKPSPPAEAAEGSTPAEAASPAAAAEAKPRKRTVRRKKAPPVVGVAPVGPPAEASVAAAAPATPSPEPTPAPEHP